MRKLKRDSNKVNEMTFIEMLEMKNELKITYDDYYLYALDKDNFVYKITDMYAHDIGINMWRFLEIDVLCYNDYILDKVMSLEHN